MVVVVDVVDVEFVAKEFAGAEGRFWERPGDSAALRFGDDVGESS